MLENSASREVNQRPQGDSGADAFTPSYHREMLMDERRVKAFQKGIQYFADPDKVFMEYGVGTGVMSAYAAKHFKHVYAIERDPFIYQIARNNLSDAGLLDSRVTLINGDVLTSDLPKADFILAELLSTLMIHEPEVAALNRARREFLNPGGTLIPQQAVNTVTPAWSKFERGEIAFRSPYTLFTGVPTPEIVGESRAFFTADFMAGEVDESVSAEVRTTCMLDSTINSLILGTHIQLAPGITFGCSDSLNPPMVVPIKPVSVRAGQSVVIEINYRHFSDWQHFSAEVR